MNKILAINGSYRDGGITDQAVEIMAQALRRLGAEVEIIQLRVYPIQFCLNCRTCTQQPGEAPGKCVQDDSMEGLIHKIEQADGYILASPTSFGSVTAVFKRFMERLVVYADWPWAASSPKRRKDSAPKKKAVLISSSAAPGIMGRLLFNTHKELKTTAQTIGARPVGTIFTGLIAKKLPPTLPERTKQKIHALAQKLVWHDLFKLP